MSVSIDENNLEQEWIKQPQLMEEALEELAEAKQTLRLMEVELDIVKAETAQDVRNNPTKYGITKVVNDTVCEAVTCDKTVVEKQKGVIQQQFKVEILSAKVTAFDHKKKALENLVQMLMQGFFGTPKDIKPKRNVMVVE